MTKERIKKQFYNHFGHRPWSSYQTKENNVLIWEIHANGAASAQKKLDKVNNINNSNRLGCEIESTFNDNTLRVKVKVPNHVWFTA